MSRLADALRAIETPRVALVGDIMLDHYTWGAVERISPEAPIPVLRVEEEEERLGGAGSVIANLVALEAEVLAAGVIGDDEAGRRIRELLAEVGAPDRAIRTVEGRPTTRKTRLLAGSQQVLRVDRETTRPIPDEVRRAIADHAREEVASSDVILISDYRKGVVTRPLVEAILEAAGDVPVIVDPHPSADYGTYRGATLVTPNRAEAARATGIEPVDPAAAFRAGEALCRDLDLGHALITLDREGMVIVSAGGDRVHVPTQPRQVFDVTGAGDMVLSVLGFATAGGLDLEDAARIANAAGGLEVQRLGVRPLRREEIAAAISREDVPYGDKVRSRAGIVEEVERLKRQGQRIVFTNGCFDILHAGHVRLLQFARAQGDVLVVGLNADASVRRLKGSPRPIVDEEGRAQVLAALADVDYVTLFDEDTPAELIEAIVPDVLVKGEDYRNRVVVGREVVEAAGGEVRLAPLLDGVSTTRIARRVASAGEEES